MSQYLVGLTDKQKEATIPSNVPLADPNFNQDLFDKGKAVFDTLVATGVGPEYTDKSGLFKALDGYTKDDLAAAQHYSIHSNKDPSYNAKDLTTNQLYWRGDVGEAIDRAARRRRGGRSRLNVQRRRTQRNGRGRKHRKLRKLATRRR